MAHKLKQDATIKKQEKVIKGFKSNLEKLGAAYEAQRKIISDLQDEVNALKTDALRDLHEQW